MPPPIKFETTKASVDSVVSKLRDWPGDPTQGLLPRPTDPGYAAHKRKLEGKAAAAPAIDKPAEPAKSTGRPDPQSTEK